MTWMDRSNEFLDGLSRPDEEAAEYLSLWVRGSRMALPPDEPSYRLIYRLAVAHQKMGQLGKLTAILLQKWISGEWRPVNLEEAAYNLLHLSAELRDSARLSSLIWRLYKGRVVQGNYQGIKLVEPLLEAMITNQTSGPEEKSLWEKLLKGSIDSYVFGSVEQGFRGEVQHQAPGQHLVDALYQVHQRIYSRMVVDGLIAYLSAVHPCANVDSYLSEVKVLLSNNTMTELTRRRNHTAMTLMADGILPDEKAEWNLRWRRVMKESIDDLKKRKPLLPFESEEIITYHLHRQFKGVDGRPEIQRPYDILYAACHNIRPPGINAPC